MNTSATGGYLRTPVAPLEDDELAKFLQAVVVGVTGLPGELVRPRWQEEPPNLPDRGKDWCAIGVVEENPDTFAVELHDGAGNGSCELLRNEVLEVLASFYGPHCGKFATLLANGLQVEQNRAVLTEAGMGLIETGRKVQVPAIIKDKWTRRVDVPIRIKRETSSTYSVLNLVAMHGTLTSSGGKDVTIAVPLSVTGP